MCTRRIGADGMPISTRLRDAGLALLFFRRVLPRFGELGFLFRQQLLQHLALSLVGLNSEKPAVMLDIQVRDRAIHAASSL